VLDNSRRDAILDSVMRKVMNTIKRWLAGTPVRTQQISYLREYDGQRKEYFVNIFEDFADYFVAYTYDRHGARCGVKRFNKENVLAAKPAKKFFNQVAVNAVGR